MSDICPHCKKDLTGNPIPEKDRESYGNHTHFSNVIAVEIQGVYAGALYNQCPECAGKWHIFEPGHYLREKAEKYIGDTNGNTSN